MTNKVLFQGIAYISDKDFLWHYRLGWCSINNISSNGMIRVRLQQKLVKVEDITNTCFTTVQKIDNTEKRIYQCTEN